MKTNVASWILGVVTGEFNREITGPLESGTIQELQRLGVRQENIRQVLVPGAVEIPLAAQALFRHANVDAVIALGAVIRGETTHYESVCRVAESGCLQVMLAEGKPVIFGVLTTENEEQAWARVGGAHGHKGVDAAQTAIRMIELIRTIENEKSNPPNKERVP